jgi:hypothetical protein
MTIRANKSELDKSMLMKQEFLRTLHPAKPHKPEGSKV